MSYLTQVPTVSLLAEGRTPHHAVMSMFPVTLPGDEHERRAGSNILFITLDDEMTLIRSDVAPVAGPPARQTITERPLPTDGSVIRFQTKVNAVHRSTVNGTTPVSDVEGWLAGKLEGALSEVTVLQHKRSVEFSGRSLLSVDAVNGQAVVADGVALAALLRRGIGRSKAFGCGMMLVAG